MGRPFNPLTVRRHYLNRKSRPALIKDFLEAIEERELVLDNNFSIRDAFESLVIAGPELLRAMDQRRGGGITLKDVMEAGAAEAVNTGDFSNITGQLIYNKVKDEYQTPQMLWPDLCTTVHTDYINGERIPGVGGIGASHIEVVGEGEEIPLVGINEEYFDAPPLNKRAFIIGITREMIIQDRTGLVVQRCGNGGKYLGINKEYRVIAAATGAVNTYNRNGVASNTYLTAGSYINTLASNPLTDWTSLEAAEMLFDGMVDPNTNLPIVLPMKQLLVPSALKRTADRILSATSIQSVDNRPNANTLRSTYDNPLRDGFYGGGEYKRLSNAFVKAVTNSITRWFIGDFKQALLYREAWGIETTQAPENNEQQFTRDIWMRFKVSEMGGTYLWEPRYVGSNS